MTLADFRMRLHVSNLSPKTTEEHLRSLFEKYGSVTILEIDRNRRPARSGGAAIVQMNPAEALTAARELNGRPVHRRHLYIALIDDIRDHRRPEVEPEAKLKPASKKDPSNKDNAG